MSPAAAAPVPADVVVFDMDGVLVDVAESYRETICRTVQHFTGRPFTREAVHDYKNRGGLNNDWELAHTAIRERGALVPLAAVIERFQQLFLGEHDDGLILRERWLAQPGRLERLAARRRLAIFTGRPRREAALTLARCARGLAFEPVMCAEDVAAPKPAPDGLVAIRRVYPGAGLVYVGDAVDDARCAQAAGVPFIGIAGPAGDRHDDLARRFAAHDAAAIRDDVNDLEAVLI